MKMLRSLFGLFVIGAAIYLGWMIAPAFLANYQFEDALDEKARMAGVQQPAKTDEQLRNEVVKEAASLGVPLKPAQVNIQRNAGSVLGGDVVIWADYTVHFDIPIYPFDLDFHPASKNKKRTGS